MNTLNVYFITIICKKGKYKANKYCFILTFTLLRNKYDALILQMIT
ncbi:hypothetical protein CLV24_105134 [Pontibacter ummariensis]|uniref:Uncharacterized protein n=1 Tax=Pontibacter ummariensis TaxID=1610492 RepID=A0A239DTP3_9BACT|nr:hypothetical protein CLV24_105134 [Pontibacter ummariensis]SNS35707.1 hypothetical protein SAMN06296052_105118 [Pontibacter ummariensis]